jgi:hypothetical protein
MGKPMPGIEAGIVEHGGEALRKSLADGAIGELALSPGWPSMMRAYLTRRRATQMLLHGWYLSGDLAMRDSDGYFWFVGRADDLIKSSGHLIGPFEVESALIEHEAVAEAGVIGVPDETPGEIVKAYVALNPGFDAKRGAERSIRSGHARKKLGPAVAPKEIVFRKTCPRPARGKIMRRLLKARELGLPEGDISTLESDEHDRHDQTTSRPRACPRSSASHDPHPASSRTNAPNFTRSRRSGASCISMTARRRSPPASFRCWADDRIVATYREHGHALVRGVPMNRRSWPRCTARPNGCAGGRGGSMHLFDPRPNFYGGNAIVGGGLPLAGARLGRQDESAKAASPPVFRRWRGGRGRVPRKPEPRRAVGSAGSVRLREQRLRHGHGARIHRIRTDIHAEGAAYNITARRWTAWMSSRWRPRRAAR